MKGDALASGARSATFQQATGQGELESDLKVQSPEFVMEKYAIPVDEYWNLVQRLKGGRTLPQLIAVPEPVFSPAKPFPMKSFGIEEAPNPQVGYEGQPVGDSVLVQRVEREHSSNLVLPDSMKAKSEIGYIVAVGEKVKRFKKGQMVMWDKFAAHGADLELIDGEGVERKLLLLKDYDILMGLKKVTLDPSPASQSPQDSSPSQEGG